MTADFYKDSEIFFTGGSGVIGKAAIEKLLRSCDVKCIYVLLRSKNGQTAETRLEQLKNSRIFKTLKECKPDELHKLVAIPGDITLDGFGIPAKYRSMMENVSVFFNSAATTRFAEPLQLAITINLKSTLEALKIAQTLPKLKIFLHVSTFFCNPSEKYIEDQVYPGKFDWKVALKLTDSSYEQSGPLLDTIANKVIQGFPNTYVFTKHLSEQLINDYRSKVPVALFRPSIVVAAMEEPEPGFTETKQGVMGLFAIWGTGLIQTLLCQRHVVLDFSPLDFTTKAMLMFTAKTAQLPKEKLQEKTQVGMFSSCNLCCHNFGEIAPMISSLVLENPYEKALWIPHITLTTCQFIFVVYNFFLQLLPAMIIDAFLKLFGQRPTMMKIQRQIYYAGQVLYFFLSSEHRSSGPTYYEEFLKSGKGTDFDLSASKNCCEGDERMKAVLRGIVRGSRKFLLNEDESSLPRCRRILKIKFAVYYVIQIAVAFLVGRAVYHRVTNYLYQ